MEYLKIAILPLVEAKDLEKKLKERGIELRLDHNEATCRRGCTVTVEVWAKEGDLAQVKQAFDENFANMLEGHEVDWDRLNQVFDPTKESAMCPACGHEFPTTEGACPDCGLHLGMG